MAKTKKNWITIAEQVLRESAQPMSAEKIATHAYRTGLKAHLGQLPGDAITSAIRRDMADRGSSSPFVVLKVRRQSVFSLK